MKITVLLWSTSVAKDSNIVPSLFFSHFFLWAFSFLWPFSLFLGLLFFMALILEQKMTLYECLQRCTGICNGPRVTCMKELWTVAFPQILCQWWMCHDEQNDGKLHGNISRNGYGNAIIGRYGGCFEEDIRRFMCERAYHITGLKEICPRGNNKVIIYFLISW